MDWKLFVAVGSMLIAGFSAFRAWQTSRDADLVQAVQLRAQVEQQGRDLAALRADLSQIPAGPPGPQGPPGPPGPPGRDASAPTGIVVAYWSEAPINQPNRHCPEGWSPLEEARGRFIIGAGDPSAAGFENWQPVGGGAAQPLKTHQPKEHLGEQEHVLTVPEMPSHDHSFSGTPEEAGGWGGGEPANIRRTSVLAITLCIDIIRQQEQ